MDQFIISGDKTGDSFYYTRLGGTCLEIVKFTGSAKSLRLEVPRVLNVEKIRRR